MARGRGRPCRADVPATCVIKVAVTPAEASAIRALAKTYRSTVSDVIRLAVLTMAGDRADGEDLPISIANGLMIPDLEAVENVAE
jgi:hypothetical protein